jgi:hypothetical protein
VIGVAGVLGLGLLLDMRALDAGATYDEGVYLASLRELQHGATLGTTLFTSQPPGFYWLLRVAGLFGSSPEAIRSVMAVVSLGGLLAAWWLVRSFAGPVAGVVAACALAVAPLWAANAARVDADEPSTVLALGALALAETTPAVAGALLAAAICVKLLAVAAVVPFGLLVRRSPVRAATGAAIALAAILLPTAGSLGAIWRDAVEFHLNARSTGASTIAGNVQRVLRIPYPQTPFGVLSLLVIAVALLAIHRRRRLPHWELWTWPVAATALLVVQRPLLDHHLVLLSAALAVPVAATAGDALRSSRGRTRTLAVAALAVAGAVAYAQQWHDVAQAAGPTADETHAVAFLRSHVAATATVASDVEIVPYLAGMRQPPQLVDLSAVRVETGSITDAEVLRASRGSAAFVVGRTIGGHRVVRRALRRRYARLANVGDLLIYYRPRAG